MLTSPVGLSRKWTCFLLVTAFALCSPLNATAAEEPVVVLYDLEARGVEPYLASSFTDLLCVELSHIKGIEARCKSDIDTILEHTTNRQLLGCRDDDGCLAQISDALGADYILRGSITKFQDSLMLIVSRVKSRGETKSAHFKETVSGQADSLLSVVHRAARHLSTDIATQSTTKAVNAAPAPSVSLSPALEAELSTFVDAWKKSWQDTATTQSLNHYASLYSRQFYSEYGRKDYDGWMADKARKLRKKQDISIELGPKGFFWTGGDEYTVTFLQHYRSSDYEDKGLKVLRLQREAGKWKIVAEEWRNQ